MIEPIQEIIAGTGVRFYPYVGEVIDHPCLLRGTIEEVAQAARDAEEPGVDGINLLAYRYASRLMPSTPGSSASRAAWATSSIVPLNRHG